MIEGAPSTSASSRGARKRSSPSPPTGRRATPRSQPARPTRMRAARQSQGESRAASLVGSGTAVAQLGERIREGRLARDIGVRELARRVECSASMISQIEKGLTNPSVNTLYAISSALGISTDRLIAGSDGPVEPEPSRDRAQRIQTSSPSPRPHRAPVVLHSADRRVLILERGVRWELLMPVPETKAEFMEVIYDVGGGSTAGDHAIRHSGREYSVILEGELSVEIGFERYVLKPGDSMAFDSTIPHRLWNEGSVPVRAIWFVQDRWASSDVL